jgi:hypothetical protein
LKTNLSLAFVLFSGATLWAADAITPLDVKLGQWESSMTIETSGQPPIPQEMLDRLTPEQRAKMEERLESSGARGPRTTTNKSCLKKEDLEKAMSFGNDQKSCNRTIVTSNRKNQEIRLECSIGGGKQSGTIRLEAVNSETVKGTTEMTMSAGGRTMNSNSTFTAKWLGPTCTERQP